MIARRRAKRRRARVAKAKAMGAGKLSGSLRQLVARGGHAGERGSDSEEDDYLREAAEEGADAEGKQVRRE